MSTINLISALTIQYGEIRTVTSAERAIIRETTSLRWYGPTHPDAASWADDAEACLLAISVTTGEPVGEILDRLDPKIERSFKRQVRESEAMAKRLNLR